MHFSIREGLLAAALIVMGSAWFVDRSMLADRLRVARIGYEAEHNRADSVTRRLKSQP